MQNLVGGSAVRDRRALPHDVVFLRVGAIHRIEAHDPVRLDDEHRAVGGKADAARVVEAGCGAKAATLDTLPCPLPDSSQTVLPPVPTKTSLLVGSTAIASASGTRA
nr:hypothetical protein [uncultured Lichenicoccus sp.]